MNQYKIKLFSIFIISVPVISSFIFTPELTSLLTSISVIFFLPLIFINNYLSPYYFIIFPILIGTRILGSNLYIYELTILFLFFLNWFKIINFKENIKFNNSSFIIFLIFIYQIFISLFYSSFFNSFFSYKVLINYIFALIFLVTYSYYCFKDEQTIQNIPYAFGLAGPLAALIALGYRVNGIVMQEVTLGIEDSNRYQRYADGFSFHYASLLRFTFTNIHLIILISIFTWIILLCRKKDLDLNKNKTIICKILLFLSIISLIGFTSKSSIFSFLIFCFVYWASSIINNLIFNKLIIKYKTIRYSIYIVLLSLLLIFSFKFLFSIEATLGDFSGKYRLKVFENLITYWFSNFKGFFSFLFGNGLFIDQFSNINFTKIIQTERAIDSFWFDFIFRVGFIPSILIFKIILNKINTSIKTMKPSEKIISNFSFITFSISLLASTIGDSKVLWLILCSLLYIYKSSTEFTKKYKN